MALCPLVAWEPCLSKQMLKGPVPASTILELTVHQEWMYRPSLPPNTRFLGHGFATLACQLSLAALYSKTFCVVCFLVNCLQNSCINSPQMQP